MPVSLAFTLAEASELLDPPMTVTQLRHSILAVGLKPAGRRYTGRGGHPTDTFDWERLVKLHAGWVAMRRCLEPPAHAGDRVGDSG